MFDFVRCVEIKRNGSTVQVIIKRLDIDPTVKVINDSLDTHEFMAASTFELGDKNIQLNNTDELSLKLLETFYRTQMKVKKNTGDMDGTVWKCRYRDNLSNTPIDSVIDFQDALNLIEASLVKKKFHIVLTQNTILLLDQKKRLWGVTKNK